MGPFISYDIRGGGLVGFGGGGGGGGGGWVGGGGGEDMQKSWLKRGGENQ